MSTAPDASKFLEVLNQLKAVSDELYQCDLSDLEHVQQLLSQRDPLIRWLQSHSYQSLDEVHQKAIEQAIQAIRGVDNEIEKRLDQDLERQSKTLQQNVKARNALAKYKFPRVSTSSGIENQA